MKISRRGFIKSATAAGAVIGFPSIVPSSVFGSNAPSNRMVLGAIGVGSQGTGRMKDFLKRDNVQIVAVCDVDQKHRDKAKNTIDKEYKNSDCKTYVDFRELIGRGDLDALSICAPDHWHAILAIAGARAGLDIFGEKPLARSIREGRAMVNAVKEYARIWQTGCQQRSQRSFRHACELIRNGRIGKVYRVEVGLPSGSDRGVQPVAPVPSGLDWNFWLGPAPWRPFCNFGRGGPHWDWRWIMDYSGGQLTDWAGHHIDIAHWGLGLEYTGPIEIEGKGEYPKEGLYNTPTSYKFTCKYVNGVEITVGDGKYFPNGTRWYGENGWIFVSREKLMSEPADIVNEEIGPGEIKLYESNDHVGNFVDCVRSRRPTIAPAEVGLRSISVGLLGEIAMLTGRKIRWNPEKEEITGDPDAGKLLGRSYREPWTL